MGRYCCAVLCYCGCELWCCVVPMLLRGSGRGVHRDVGKELESSLLSPFKTIDGKVLLCCIAVLWCCCGCSVVVLVLLL